MHRKTLIRVPSGFLLLGSWLAVACFTISATVRFSQKYRLELLAPNLCQFQERAVQRQDFLFVFFANQSRYNHSDRSIKA